MRKYFGLLIISSVLIFPLTAKNKSDKMYRVLQEMKGVTYLSFSRQMLDAVNLDLGDEFSEVVTGDLYEIRLVTYNPGKGKFSGPAFLKRASSMLPSRYKRLEDKHHDIDDAEIWVLGRGRKYKECHVFFPNAEQTGRQFILSFYGNFQVHDPVGLKNAGENLVAD